MEATDGEDGPGTGCPGWCPSGSPWALCGDVSKRSRLLMTFGVSQVTCAFLLAVIYFSIRTLTTSLENVETIPTYTNAILLVCTGIVVMFLYKRQDPVLLIASLVLDLVCGLLSVVSLVLLGVGTIHTITNFKFCLYDSERLRCHCYTVEEEQVGFRQTDYTYNNAPSCAVIENNLRHLTYVLCALYVTDATLCTATSTVLALVFFGRKQQLRLLENMQLPGLSDIRVEDDSDSQQFESRASVHQPLTRSIFNRPVSLPGMSGVCQGLLRVQRRGSIHGRVPLGEVDAGRGGLCPVQTGHGCSSSSTRQSDPSTARTPRWAESDQTIRNWQNHVPVGQQLHLMQFVGVTSLTAVSRGVYAYPSDPPPPLRPSQLPPYLGYDPAPSYKSQDSGRDPRVNTTDNSE